MSDKTPREDVLQEAITLITGDRNHTYGSPTQNFQDTADVLNVLLRPKLKEDQKITPGEVASIMIGLKLVRQIAQPKRDNWTDIAGYAGCGYEADVETGRINEPTENTPWGKPGDKLSITATTPEPTFIQVFEDLSNPGEWPFLHQILGTNKWAWSSSPTEIFGDGNEDTWQGIKRFHTGTTLKVVR